MARRKHFCQKQRDDFLDRCSESVVPKITGRKNL